MLSKSSVTTMLAVNDLDRARRFYEDRLGLQPVGSSPDGTFNYQCGTTRLGLMPRPGSMPSQYTAMSFEVPDIESEVADLESRGVVFEDYDTPELHTVNHICSMGSEKAAWFKDTEGNFLCIHQAMH